MNEKMIKEYAYGKFHKLISNIFLGLESARIKFEQNNQLFFLIQPKDFKMEKHQKLWSVVQKLIIGKLKNYGTEKFPTEKIIIRNKTVEMILTHLWSIFEDCVEAEKLNS